MHDEIAIQYVPIEELKPCEYNARIWTEEARRQLTKSLDDFGFVQPIVVNSAPNRRGVIIGGNFKLDIAKSKGMKTLPVVWVNIPDINKEKILNLRLNKNQGSFDNDLLAEFDPSMLADVGFDSKELDKIFDEETEEEFDPELEAAAIVTPIAKRGDVYEIGKHRLMCGDSTDSADVAKLMGGVAADLVFCDPPYNIDYTGKTKDALKIQNDNKSSDDFKGFLTKAFKRMHEVLKPGGSIYICHADTERINFTQAFLDAGFKLSSVIIWVKNNATFGRQDYFWKHEPILYGWKEGAAHNFQGNATHTTLWEHAPTDEELLAEMRKIVVKDETGGSTVWRVDRPARSAEHPTMKPVKLIAIAVRNSSKRSDVVLDLFNGSGSTMVCCSEINRTCYAMELDEKYVDVGIKRMLKLDKDLELKRNGEIISKDLFK